MSKLRYYCVRPIDHKNQNHRIEQATSPEHAYGMVFGRGNPHGFEYKDLGTRKSEIQSDRKRIALLKDPAGWVAFGSSLFTEEETKAIERAAGKTWSEIYPDAGRCTAGEAAELVLDADRIVQYGQLDKSLYQKVCKDRKHIDAADAIVTRLLRSYEGVK